ncbi:unnamed protein product, partial [Amoebophrya sp. A25]
HALATGRQVYTEGKRTEKVELSEIYPDLNAEEIGIVVAANTGLPGGGTCKIPEPKEGDDTKDAGDFPLQLDQIKSTHRSQEESVGSNWYVHQTAAKWVAHQDGKSSLDGGTAEALGRLYASTIKQEWGLKTNKEDDFETWHAPGVDFRTTENPIDFADCWVVRNAKVGPESERRALFTGPNTINGYYVVEQGQEKQVLVGRPVSLFFVAAPNGGSWGGTAHGSQRRTFSKKSGGWSDYYTWRGASGVYTYKYEDGVEELQDGTGFFFFLSG